MNFQFNKDLKIVYDHTIRYGGKIHQIDHENIIILILFSPYDKTKQGTFKTIGSTTNEHTIKQVLYFNKITQEITTVDLRHFNHLDLVEHMKIIDKAYNNTYGAQA